MSSIGYTHQGLTGCGAVETSLNWNRVDAVFKQLFKPQFLRVNIFCGTPQRLFTGISVAPTFLSALTTLSPQYKYS